MSESKKLTSGSKNSRREAKTDVGKQKPMSESKNRCRKAKAHVGKQKLTSDFNSRRNIKPPSPPLPQFFLPSTPLPTTTTTTNTSISNTTLNLLYLRIHTIQACRQNTSCRLMRSPTARGVVHRQAQPKLVLKATTNLLELTNTRAMRILLRRFRLQ
jgi:hypothetical protein